MKFDFHGKRAAVTGGSSGIGKAICIALCAQGAEVYLLDADKENGRAVVKEVKSHGGRVFFHHCDVVNQAEVRKAFKTIDAQGPLSILVNNAGIAHIGNVEQTEEKQFENVFAVNVKGVYNCLYAAVPMMKKKGGVILNIASIAGTVGIKNRFAYSASKGAVQSMTYSVAKDYVDAGIRCNSISPARIHTPFVDRYLKQHFPGEEASVYETLAKTQPIGRMGTPKEVADLVVYLSSDEASFMTGTDFPIDGGFIKLNGN